MSTVLGSKLGHSSIPFHGFQMLLLLLGLNILVHSFSQSYSVNSFSSNIWDKLRSQSLQCQAIDWAKLATSLSHLSMHRIAELSASVQVSESSQDVCMYVAVILRKVAALQLVAFWLAAKILLATRIVRDFQGWKLMGGYPSHLLWHFIIFYMQSTLTRSAINTAIPWYSYLLPIMLISPRPLYMMPQYSTLLSIVGYDHDPCDQ